MTQRLSERVPRLQQLLLFLTLLLVLCFSLFRLAFWVTFENPADPIPSSIIANTFYLGLKYDIQLALLLLLPVFLLGWIRFLDPFRIYFANLMWKIYITAVFLFSILFFLTDFGYYAYLNTRINATSLRFLENPLISAQMIWESYPVISGGVILLIVVLLFWKIIHRGIDRISNTRVNNSRTHTLIVTTFAVFIILLGLFGKISWYPLRWSDAFFSTHPFSAAVASNPIIYFANTLKRRITYDAKKTREQYDVIAAYLGVDNPDREKLIFTRTKPAAPDHGATNIVIVVLESFASYKSSLAGNPLDPTPNLNELAKDGVYFNNFFVPHTGTARSIWTLITGIPDVEEHKTSTRNPLIVNQHTIVNAFDRHNKFYFLGGSASWANLRGVLSGNIPDLKIYEEGSYESPRIDVWGISDLDLFREASSVLAKQKDHPFFAIIQTSGNHRPYTIPENNYNFKPVMQDEKKIKQYGFISLDEYNSFRFMDHSIGYFINEAKKQPWFANTLFVFFGDHGLNTKTISHMPDSELLLKITSNRVPLVIYGPGLKDKGKILSTVASEVDLLPTIAGLAGIGYNNTTLGRDLFDNKHHKSRYAFTIAHDNNHELGLIGDGYLFLLKKDGTSPRLHRLDSSSPRDNVASQHPAQTAAMRQILTALYETAKYMRHNNQPGNLASQGHQ